MKDYTNTKLTEFEITHTKGKFHLWADANYKTKDIASLLSTKELVTVNKVWRLADLLNLVATKLVEIQPIRNNDPDQAIYIL